jgi:hypothetical protein
MTAHRAPFFHELGLISSQGIARSWNGTLLQNLWVRAAERAVFR